MKDYTGTLKKIILFGIGGTILLAIIIAILLNQG